MERSGNQHGRVALSRGIATWTPCVLALIAWLAPVQPARLVADQAATSTAPATLPAHELLNLTSSADPAIRRQAALAIAENGSPDSIKAIASLLDAKNGDPAKLAMLQALVENKAAYPGLFPHLLALIEYNEPAVRKAARYALNQYSDPAIAAKIQAYVQEREAALLAENHTALMKAMYDFTPESDRSALLLAWLKQPVPLERRTALEIVQQSLRKGASDDQILEYVRTMLNDLDVTVRQKAILVLRTRGLREDAPRIRAMLQEDQSALVRDAIYNALGVLGDPSSIPAAIQGLKDPTDTVASEAATALGRLCELQPAPPKALLTAAVEALQLRCSQPIADPVLRERIIDAMSRIAHPSFVPVLSRHATADEAVPAVRQAAIRGLGRINDPEATNIVMDRMAADTDAGVREAAVEALGKMGTNAEHLKAIRRRLDPKVETATAVLNKAWEAYSLIFMKLSPADQKNVLDSWTGAHSADIARRIELLTHIEKAMTTAKSDPRQLTDIREQLGDDLLASSRPADAVVVLVRGLESIPAVQHERRVRCALKLIAAHLRTPTPDKAISLAADMDVPAFKPAAAPLFLQFIQDLAASDPAAARDYLGKLRAVFPDSFGPDWSDKFSAILTTMPATQPATAAAN